MTIKFMAACAALVSLSACDTPVAATAGQTDFNSARATFAALSDNPRSAEPGGSASYIGKISSNATINEGGGYTIVGDMEMDIDFASNGTNVSGSITQVNLIDSLNADGTQTMTNGAGTETPGTLTISGSRVDSGIFATATGQLGAVLPDSGIETRAAMNLQMAGSVRSTVETSDTVLGTFTGVGAATSLDGMAVTLSNGQFYGRN